MLAGVNVALGVSGSIAAVKCVELAHELRRNGASVRAITSPSATGIIHPWALEFATDRPVVTEITGKVEHVDLCGYDGWADVLLIAPSTANTIGKMAASVDDTPVTTCATTAIGAGLPVVIAPAMHEPMWEHPGVLGAIEQLTDWGVSFVPPNLAEGKAKLASESTIVTAVATATSPDDLADTHIIVTSGPTAEPIDPVRVITNRSSGQMGRAIARACAIRGATVTVLHGGPDLSYAEVRNITTTSDMIEAAEALAPKADALVSAAAIGDFTVGETGEKLDSGKSHEISLQPVPKVVDVARAANPELEIVGFKAEHNASTETLTEAAQSLRDRIDAAFVVANDANTMGAEDTHVLLVGDEHEALSGRKTEVGTEIAHRLAMTLTEVDGT